MSEPATKEEYEKRYHDNFKVTGFGIEGVTNHFPCPFCAAPDWHVVRVIDFGPGMKEGRYESVEQTCEECGRSAKHVSERSGGVVSIWLVQTGGDDPPDYVPISRARE